MMSMLNQINRLRTSCAPAVGHGDFKKLKTEDGAVQPITAAIWFRCASPKFCSAAFRKNFIQPRHVGRHARGP